MITALAEDAADKHFGQAELIVDAEDSPDTRTAQIGIEQQRPAAKLSEGNRQVGGDIRGADLRLGACHSDAGLALVDVAGNDPAAQKTENLGVALERLERDHQLLRDVGEIPIEELGVVELARESDLNVALRDEAPLDGNLAE